MTVKMIESIAKRHDIGVYDLEWNPDTMALTLFGVNDGQRYRAFRTVQDGMDYMLQSHFAGKWWFAHNGGLADMVFLLEYFRKCRNVEVNARFSGSSAVLVEVRKEGKTKSGKSPVWKFCDSFFLLRTRLAKIGEHMGMLKGESHGTELYYQSFEEILATGYNEQDCAILLAAVNQFQEQILEMGGEMKPTIAATALNLFKRRYLTDDIRTTDWVNHIVRGAYIASRVEVFRKYGEDLSQWDINSSFPSSMIHPTPGKLLSMLGDGKKSSINLPDYDDDCWFAECTIDVPDGMPIPPLPLRKNSRVYFPTGSWRQWFSGPDIKLLEECGGRVLTAHQVLKFEPRIDLRGYVKDIYAKRLASTSPFEKEIFKLLMNALYGKWAEQAWKGSILFNPQNVKKALEEKRDKDGFVIRTAQELVPGIVAVEEKQEIEHEHVPFAAHITSNSRALITRYLWQAASRNREMPYYCDSVTGDRTVVVKSPDGDTEIVPIAGLWEECCPSEREDGKGQGTLEGWKALARDDHGVEGWFPIKAIIRHRTRKDLWLVSSKRGQTCVTSDHGIMAQADENGGVTPVTPADFVREKMSFEIVSAIKPIPKRIDLWRVLSRFEERKFELLPGGERIALCALHGRQPSGSIQRYFEPDMPETRALLRLVAAYISEGSASILGVTSVRTCLSIAQNRKEWLEELLVDLNTISDASARLVPTGNGMWAIRSGAFLTHIFWVLCGIKSSGKKLPSFAYELSHTDFEVLWSELVEGDGNIDQTGRRVYTTKSQQLAAGLSYLLDQHGKEHGINYRHGKTCWTLRERAQGSERKGCRAEKVVRRRADDEYVYDLSVEDAHTFVDGLGRVLLHNTDCVVMHGQLEDSKELGKMKLEKKIDRGIFLAPKFYMKDDETRAKGFPKLDVESFQNIAELGYAHRVERMARPKEVINDFAAKRRPDMLPRNLQFPKRLRLLPENAKRVFTFDGDQSRPFSTGEIEAGAGEIIREWSLPEGWTTTFEDGFARIFNQDNEPIHTNFNGEITQ